MNERASVAVAVAVGVSLFGASAFAQENAVGAAREVVGGAHAAAAVASDAVSRATLVAEATTAVPPDESAEPADVADVAPDIPTEELSDEEAEMFGESAPPLVSDAAAPESGTTPTGPSELDAPLLSNTTIDERLTDADRALAIGAYGNFRFQYAALDEGAPEGFRFSSPSLADLYADGRPNDRVRLYARGRLNTDLSLPVATSEEANDAPFSVADRPRVFAALDQLWLKFDVARVVFMTVGKQRIKWGTGRFWNPTDFLNQDRLDPLSVAVFDERLGVSLVKAHVPLETLGWNFYAVASLDEASSPETIGGAFRAEFLYDLTEVSLSTAVRKNNPLRLGADISTALWLFDLRLEAAVFHNDRRPFFEGEFALPSTFPSQISRKDDWIPQVVGGAEITIQLNDEDTTTLGAEYFFNDMGYDDEGLYPWLAANGAFTPFYLGRHYGGVYGLLAGPGSWNDSSFVLSALGNISDRSFIARFDFGQTILTELRFNAFLNWHFGQGEFKYRFQLPPSPLVPEGLVLVPPLFETGVGFQLSL